RREQSRKRHAHCNRQHRRSQDRHDQTEGHLRQSGTSALAGTVRHVSLTLDTRNNAVMVPAEAVQAGQNSQFVYVVKPDKTVESRVVTVGSGKDGKVIIEKGVQAGETVVTDGQLRLFPGARIEAVTAAKASPRAQ